MNGVPVKNEPIALQRKDSERFPLIDLEAQDRIAEEELRHKAFLEEESRRLAHQEKQASPSKAEKP